MGPLNIYLDTSVIVPLFLADPFVSRARAFLQTEPVGLLVSEFVSAEFAFVIAWMR
jgi:predicted nucleic acid-binding protein